MIIAKNGTQYNEITNEIIKAHATYVNSPFAKVDRALNYKQVDDGEFQTQELIDDFTKDELTAGFFEVAKIANQDTLELYANKFFNDDLEIQRYIKLEKLKSIKDEKLSEFSYKDKIYQIDENSKININGKISAILLSQNTEAPIQNVAWIAKDNTITQFSTAEFLAFSNAVAQYIESVLFKHDELRTRVNSASSIDEIKAIEWVD
ncbi:DUF4376 domain-containing protein [Campylobacter lanienae]|uniref:DUF4376 domain-containing protein n=1 Tax=Campylobacter lanienae TaxID=75658 RepID=UPI000BB3EA7D|nr:DUF4376 domain-containing protein [Campylobacter lanienae]